MTRRAIPRQQDGLIENLFTKILEMAQFDKKKVTIATYGLRYYGDVEELRGIAVTLRTDLGTRVIIHMGAINAIEYQD